MSHDELPVIVFTDIVGFSKYVSYKQNRIITSLNAELSRELFAYLGLPGPVPSLIGLPTGDGVALVFLGGCKADVLFPLLHCLINWTRTVTERERLDPVCKIRVGVHAGTVSVVTDINRLPNVCGDNINTSRRVMDQARPNQVLFSESAYDQYFRQDDGYARFPFSRERPAEFSPPMPVIAKHDKLLSVRVMWHKDDDGWCREPPMSVPTVIDGKGAALRRTEVINDVLRNLAADTRKPVTVYEMASFSTFSIGMNTEDGHDPELIELCLVQRRLLEELLARRPTTVRVIIRPVPAARTEWPGVNARLEGLAGWMDEHLDGDAFRPSAGAPPTDSTVRFREGRADELKFWRAGGPNVFLVRDSVRVDGYRIRNTVSLGLSLVYYEESKIKEAEDEFLKVFGPAAGQSNADVRKKLEVFRPAAGTQRRRSRSRK